MNNKKISNLEFSILATSPILSLYSGIGLYNLIKRANIDAYIAIFISIIWSLLYLKVFLTIYNYEPNSSLPEKNIKLFGKNIGKIINIIINILILSICILPIYSISNFIVSQFLSETPIIIILILIFIVSLYNISKGIEVISRTAIVLFIISLSLGIINIIGLLPDFQFTNLKPILANGITIPLKTSFLFLLTNIVPIVTVLIIPKNNIVNNNKTSKYIYIFFIISLIFILLDTILTIGVLSEHLIKILPHPEYIVLKKISIFGFIDRIENIIYIKWILGVFVHFTLSIYYICNSINKKDKQFFLPSIVIIFILTLSKILFKNNTEFKWYIKNIYPYTNLVLLVIIILIFILILIHNKKET